MWLRRWTTKLLWNLKVLPQNSQDLALFCVCGGVVLLGGTDGSGGVLRKGDLGPGWKGLGFKSRCIGVALLGDSGGVVLLLFPASSRNLLEKSMDCDSMAMGVSRITLSKALGCWEMRPISSALRRSSRWGSRWWRGGGLMKGGVLGRRLSKNPGGGSRSNGPDIRSRLKGLFSPRKLVRGDWGMESLTMGGGMLMRGVRAELDGLDSR